MNVKQHAIDTVKFAHSTLNKALESIPHDKATHQPFPEANHALWTYGHLANTYGWLCTMLDAKANAGVPDSFNGLFGMGSKPHADKSKYPPLADVKKAYDKAFTMYLGLLEKLGDKDLWSPTASDSMGFATSKIDSAYKCAWHDGWHLGQITDIRRPMKLPSLF